MRHTRIIFTVAAILSVFAFLYGCQSKMVVGRSSGAYKAERPAEPETVAAPNKEAPASEPAVEQAAPEPATPEPAAPEPAAPEPAADQPAPEPAVEPAAEQPAEQPAEPAVQAPVTLPPSVKEETVEAPSAQPRSSSKRRPEGTQESPYELDLSLGGPGISEGYLDTPVAVAVDEDENIYVLDQGNQRVECFDQYGEYQFMWGVQGGGGPDEYAVSDVGGVETLRMTGNFDFNFPSDMILENDGRWDLNLLTVTDTLNHRIQRFIVTKNDIDTFPEEAFVMLPKSGTTTYPDTELMARYESDGTRVLLDPVYLNDSKADAFVPRQYVWGGFGIGEDNFNRPTGLIKGEENLLYVADTGNRRVLVFYDTPQTPMSDTEYYFQIGNDIQYPYGEGRLNEPTVVAYDNSGYGSILVLDKNTEGNFIIQRFSKEGEFMGVLDLSGNPSAKPRYPVDMVLNPFDNTIFITDKGYRSVMVYNNKGEFMFSIGGEELKDPRGIAVLRNGFVYVTDAASNMVYRYVPR